MAKRKRQKTKIKEEKSKRGPKASKPKLPKIDLPVEVKNWVWGISIFVVAMIFFLSFVHKAGVAGEEIKIFFELIVGRTFFLMPFILILGSIVFFTTKYKKFFGPTVFATAIMIIGLSGILFGLNPQKQADGMYSGGLLGFLISSSILKFFGFWVNQIIFGSLIIFGVLIFWYLLKPRGETEEEQKEEKKEKKEISFDEKPSLITKIFSPKLKVKEIDSALPEEAKVEQKAADSASEFKTREVVQKAISFEYQAPPIDLLDSGKEAPTSGDIKLNSAVIKKTLQNFDIPVEMGEVNIGPTVTQYTFKPAEGIKLSKITGLANDLSLSLAAHPLRIEAPIPGRSLVGVEIPNKVRAKVRFKELVSSPVFQTSPAVLNIALGRDVSGAPVYSDLSKMPHLLVAGSTGSGKTIYLNTLILSLIYRNSPQILNFILVDPKRVEFPVYNDLPHLLAPVIYDANRAVNALRWLISEMERRFKVLSEVRARDIGSYNQVVAKGEIMPYIVLVVDELADLMAARGRDMEAGIVRLAQMARAVGIHLVLATQRPSVEVITGLIKANITSRVTFQVASQVDSRTIIDMAGAEKLLGRGDMLFLSSELGKARRLQGAYLSDKEVKRVVNYVVSKNENSGFAIDDEVLNTSSGDGARGIDAAAGEFNGDFGDDPLLDEAKRVVVEAKKASASLLQRRLRIGYARAARLIDMLEEKGIVGPGEGAKPREVYGDVQQSVEASPEEEESGEDFKPIDLEDGEEHN